MNFYSTTSKTIIKYALDIEADKAIHIDNAKRKKIYKCFGCKNEMDIVQGEKNEWHFRHKDKSQCKGGPETAIHKLGKQIIVDNTEMKIPGETLIYSNAEQEKSLGSFRPDVTILLTNGEYVHIEIVVTNPVEDKKREFYHYGKHRSIEIDLRVFIKNEFIEEDDLKKIMLDLDWCKKPIYWTEKEIVKEVELISKESNFYEAIEYEDLIIPKANNNIQKEKESIWENKVFIILLSILVTAILFFVFKNRWKKY